MNLNLYLTELKMNLKTTLIWTTGIVIAILLVLISAGSVARTFNEIESSSISGVHFLFPIYSIITYFIMFIGSMFTMIFGSTILSKEEDYKTIEIMYSIPIKRSEIVLSKYLAFFSCIILMNIAILIAIFVNFEIFKPSSGYDVGLLFQMILNQFLVMLFMGSFSFLLSLFVIRGGAAIGISIGINIMMIISFSLGMSGESYNQQVLKTIGYFSIYRYCYRYSFSVEDFANPQINTLAMICFAGAILIFIMLALFIYNKKDFQN